MDDEIDHHNIFVIDFCQAFKLGQETSLKHLNNLLLIPLTKCLRKKTSVSKITSSDKQLFDICAVYCQTPV